MIDILIIGSGGAGLTTALEASKNGAKVLVVGKSYPTNSQTSMAQGGINSALGNMDDDSVASHIEDTLKSAKGLADEVMIKKMCEDAPASIKWLESIGVGFSRDKNCNIAQRKLGGATHKRACYSQDYTGLKILHTLYDNALKENIEFLNEHYLLNFITDNSKSKPKVVGATLFDITNGEVIEIKASCVVVATGGYSSIYHGFTTNSFESLGDGISATIRAGGDVSDMEFIQFHPTALKSSGILISESARGEGGYLLNSDGDRFVDELKPRDEVSRAIMDEIEKGKDVFLDLRHLGEEKLMELLPQEIHLCKLHENINPVEQIIPIKPVAHYTMGGIDVNQSLEVNGLDGLFAVGECSNSKVHGANRLGGNSLLEIISFGRLAGKNAYNYAKDSNNIKLGTGALAPAFSEAKSKKSNTKDIKSSQLSLDKEYIKQIYNYPNQINFYEKKEFIGKLLYNNAGIKRNKKDLIIALDEIKTIKLEIELMGIGDKSKDYNKNLMEFVEFINLLELCKILLQSALDRKESVGAHYRCK